MSAEHAMRWQHRTQPPRITSHWSATDPNRWHDGPVDGCPICHPQDGAA